MSVTTTHKSATGLLKEEPPSSQEIAREIAIVRVNAATTNLWSLLGDIVITPEPRYDLTDLTKAMAREHGVAEDDVVLEAGFALGLEVGKLLNGGVR